MQVPPGWQTAPTQHVPPSAPQLWQVRGAFPGGLAQPRPPLQVARAQQAWPSAPHGAHDSAAPPSPAAWQENPLKQLSAAPPPQHAWPPAPQAAQEPIAPHETPDAVHIDTPVPLPPQQVCPRAPQAMPAAF